MSLPLKSSPVAAPAATGTPKAQIAMAKARMCCPLPPFTCVRLNSTCFQFVNFEPGRALELAFGQLRRQLRVDGTLTRLAVEVGANNDPASALRVGDVTGLLDQ